MTHPFALSIEDLACLELVDETMPIAGGVNVAASLAIRRPVSHKPFDLGPGGCILTIGYNNENGGHPTLM